MKIERLNRRQKKLLRERIQREINKKKKKKNISRNVKIKGEYARPEELMDFHH